VSAERNQQDVKATTSTIVQHYTKSTAIVQQFNRSAVSSGQPSDRVLLLAHGAHAGQIEQAIVSWLTAVIKAEPRNITREFPSEAEAPCNTNTEEHQMKVCHGTILTPRALDKWLRQQHQLFPQSSQKRPMQCKQSRVPNGMLGMYWT
jgi:hypothetical protein